MVTVSKIERKGTKPTVLEMRAVRSALRYLSRTFITAFVLAPGDSTQLSAKVDANWVG